VALKGRRGSPRPRIALVCAGGGITGAVYEIGCLRALEDILDRSSLDLDLYVGVSGGAFVTSLLAAGVSPREMYDELTRHDPFGMRSRPFVRFGAGQLMRRWYKAPGVLREALFTALWGEGRNGVDLFFSLFELLPPGLLDNSGIQEYLAKVFRDRGGNDEFNSLARELHVIAVDLDSGEAVAFGQGGLDVPVSRAVQASTALPGLYRPVRIEGRDYVDGAVKKTAHIHVAIERGAGLVICINPIVPLLNDTRKGPFHGHLSNKGVTYVLDQALRIMLHGRLRYGIERYRRDHPDVDLLVLEPTREETRMFSYNIMRYSARKVLAEYGYRSVLESFRKNFRAYKTLLGRHGIRVRDVRDLPLLPPVLEGSRLARNLKVSLDLLERRLLGSPRPAESRASSLPRR